MKIEPKYKIFIHENAYENIVNIVCEKAAISSKGNELNQRFLIHDGTQRTSIWDNLLPCLYISLWKFRTGGLSSWFVFTHWGHFPDENYKYISLNELYQYFPKTCSQGSELMMVSVLRQTCDTRPQWIEIKKACHEDEWCRPCKGI